MKRISELIPSVTILVILLGYFNIYRYYLEFGINIIPFLETSEIVFAFGALAQPFTALFIMYVIGYGVTSSPHPLPLTLSKIKSITLDEKYYLGPMLVWMAVVWGSYLLIREHSLAIYNFGELENITLLTLVLIPLFLFQIIARVFTFKSLSVWLATIVLVVFYIVSINRIKADLIVGAGVRVFNVAVTLKEGKVIKSDSVFVFIGSTSNYVFFHSRETGQTTIIPTSEIQRFDHTLFSGLGI